MDTANFNFYFNYPIGASDFAWSMIKNRLVSFWLIDSLNWFSHSNVLTRNNQSSLNWVNIDLQTFSSHFSMGILEFQTKINLEVKIKTSWIFKKSNIFSTSKRFSVETKLSTFQNVFRSFSGHFIETFMNFLWKLFKKSQFSAHFVFIYFLLYQFQ